MVILKSLIIILNKKTETLLDMILNIEFLSFHSPNILKNLNQII